MNVNCNTNYNSTSGAMAAVGMFDGVHTGHRYLLELLRQQAALRGLTPIAITFSNHPLEIIAPQRAPRLLTPPPLKSKLIETLGVVPVVIPFNEALRQTDAALFLELINKKFGVSTLLMGFNNRFGHNAPATFADYIALGKKMGVEIVEAKEFKPGNADAVSSTAIRNLLDKGRVKEATQLLGRPYRLEGTVEHGYKLGRTIGFPTANLKLADNRQLIPANGVYATLADGNPAMTNIGKRPTVEQAQAATTIETHIIDFEKDLYNSPIAIDFIEQLREERKFNSIDELRLQLCTDRDEALQSARSIIENNYNNR